MKKYFRYISVIILAALVGCATHVSQKKTLPASIDPDGDNDAKGIAHFALERAPTGKRVFIYDPKVNAWAVYDEEGHRKNVGRASGGKLFCPDIGKPCQTAAGQYRILRKNDESCTSSIYPLDTNGGAPMPYCMHFNKDGSAIHGVNFVPDRYNSHGCIGVTTKAAKWLHDFLHVGSTVIVRSY